jgi:hypothetical protein
MSRSGRTVSRIAKELGLSFERGDQVKAATEARKVDAKARRAELALALLDDAARLRAQIWQPCTIHNFGGRDNTHNSHDIDEPLFADKLKLMQAATLAAGKAIDIDRYDSGTGLGEVVSLLDRLAASLGAKYGNGDDEHPIADPVDG